MPINQFKGPYRFLSNFYPSPIRYDGVEYPTVEHFFQAMKAKDKSVREHISLAPTPALAKREGGLVEMRQDWSQIRNDVMLAGLRLKFQYKHLRDALLATGSQELIEGNWWGDSYWGVDLKTGVGDNILGTLLQQVRDELQKPLDCKHESRI